MKATHPDYADNHQERSWSPSKKSPNLSGFVANIEYDVLHENVTRNWRVAAFSSLLCRPTDVHDDLYEVDEA